MWFDFVWQSARRLGVNTSAIDDVVQDVFLVVHRRLPDFAGRSSIKTWLFGITLRVAQDHRRRARRKRVDESLDDVTIRDDHANPMQDAEKAEAVRLLYSLLDELDDEKREVFVLAELEQMTAPEMADALETNVNTIYSRLRAARSAFNEAVVRHKARDRRHAP